MPPRIMTVESASTAGPTFTGRNRNGTAMHKQVPRIATTRGRIPCAPFFGGNRRNSNPMMVIANSKIPSLLSTPSMTVKSG